MAWLALADLCRTRPSHIVNNEAYLREHMALRMKTHYRRQGEDEDERKQHEVDLDYKFEGKHGKLVVAIDQEAYRRFH